MKKEEIKIMTMKEYANARGVTVQAISQNIKNGHTMPGVATIDRFGNCYVFHVYSDQLKRLGKSKKKIKLHV